MLNLCHGRCRLAIVLIKYPTLFCIASLMGYIGSVWIDVSLYRVSGCNPCTKRLFTLLTWLRRILSIMLLWSISSSPLLYNLLAFDHSINACRCIFLCDWPLSQCLILTFFKQAISSKQVLIIDGRLCFLRCGTMLIAALTIPISSLILFGVQCFPAAEFTLHCIFFVCIGHFILQWLTS